MKDIERLYSLFTDFLQKNPFQGEPKTLYEAKNYLLQIGGKRARPIALLAALEAFDPHTEKGLNAAWAFEVFHNFTLAHDDIMDNAPMRRGKNALHTEYNTSTAILAGDNMMLCANEYLLKYDTELALNLIQLLTQTGKEICEGQYIDMDFEERDVVSEAEYIQMIRLKTSVLLGACFKAGGLIGGASNQQVNQLYEMGVELGIGFQIMDDLLDAFSNNPKVGKVQGGDILANKKTILWIQAMTDANESQKEKLNHWFSSENSNSTDKVNEVLKIFKELNIERKVKLKMNKHYQNANSIFNELAISKNSALFQFIEFISTRTY